AGLLGRPVEKNVRWAVALAIAGTILLCWPDANTAATYTITSPSPLRFLGETLTVVAALVFTVQIISLDHFGQRADSARLTAAMLLTTTLISLAIALAASGLPPASALAQAATDGPLWGWLATLVIFSSVMALHLMNRYQPAVSPATA